MKVPLSLPGVPFSPSAAILVSSCSGQQGRGENLQAPVLGTGERAGITASPEVCFLLCFCDLPAPCLMGTLGFYSTEGRERPNGWRNGKVGVGAGFGASLSSASSPAGRPGPRDSTTIGL